MADTDVLSNLIVELKRGTLILAVLSQLKEEAYGYSLLERLTDKGILIEAGTLYPLLRRLESQGLLSSNWDTTESRPRKFYVISEEGKITYQALLDTWKKMQMEMNHLLEG